MVPSWHIPHVVSTMVTVMVDLVVDILTEKSAKNSFLQFRGHSRWPMVVNRRLIEPRTSLIETSTVTRLWWATNLKKFTVKSSVDRTKN